MNKKLKDTDSKKTEKLSNQLTVLTANLKTVVKTAFRKIVKAGKDIDEQMTILRNSLLDKALYEIDSFNDKKSTKVKEAFDTMVSMGTYIDCLYNLAGEEKKDFRDTYLHKSFTVVAKTVVLLCDAMRNNTDVKVKILSTSDLDKNKMLVSRIEKISNAKEKKFDTFRMYENDLVVEYNYLFPTFKVLNSLKSTSTNKIYDEVENDNDSYIPLNHRAVEKLYALLHGEKRDGEETDTPNPIDTIDGFVDYVNSVSEQFNLWAKQKEKILANYNLGTNKMKNAVQELVSEINSFKDCAENLLSEDNPDNEKQLGTIKNADIKNLKEKFASK